MGKAPVLHELLAVEGDLEGTFKKVVEETKVTFGKKENLFMGQHRKLEVFDESDKTKYPEEIKEVDETVKSKLAYMVGHVSKYFDAIYQKEATNQMATSDLVVDGNVVAEKLPATFLLGLESRLKMVRSVLEEIPTLETGIKWVADPSKGEDIFCCEPPEEKMKTAKTFQHKVLYEATKEHPAVIEKWEETINVGKFTRHIWSGKVTSTEKSRLLGNLDKLIREVKKARQRANTQEAVTNKVSAKILDVIFS